MRTARHLAPCTRRPPCKKNLPRSLLLFTCVSASARQSRAQCRAREFCCKIPLYKTPSSQFARPVLCRWHCSSSASRRSPFRSRRIPVLPGQTRTSTRSPDGPRFRCRHGLTRCQTPRFHCLKLDRASSATGRLDQSVRSSRPTSTTRWPFTTPSQRRFVTPSQRPFPRPSASQPRPSPILGR